MAEVEVTWGLSGGTLTFPWHLDMVAAELCDQLAKMKGLTFGQTVQLLQDMGGGMKLSGQQLMPAGAALRAIVADHSMCRQTIAMGEFHALMVLDGELKVSAGGRYRNCCTDDFPDLPENRGRRVVSVAAAGLTSLVLLDDGNVLVLHGDGKPQLPDREGRRAVAVAAARNHAVVLLEDGDVQISAMCRNCGSAYTTCDCNVNAMQPELHGRCAAAVAAGTRHFLIILEDGGVLAFGENTHGQTDVPDLAGQCAIAAAGGDNHSLVLLSDGNVLAWGGNDEGQTDVPDLAGRRAISVAAAKSHSLVLLEDGCVLAFGCLPYGILSNIPDAVELSGQQAVAIAAGDYSALALLSNGDVVACGEMDHPQNGEPTIELHFRSPSQGHFGNATDVCFLGWGCKVARKCLVNEASAQVRAQFDELMRSCTDADSIDNCGAPAGQSIPTTVNHRPTEPCPSFEHGLRKQDWLVKRLRDTKKQNRQR